MRNSQFILCLLILVLLHTYVTGDFIRESNSRRPNFIIILTDDQDSVLGGLQPMTKTRALLEEEGAKFVNAYATTPVCCPSRASILTGLYQHNHHVLNNTLRGGCSSREWQQHHEKNTFATELQREGYSTFYGGKYMNTYGFKGAGGPEHIPPGWDQWIGLVGNSKYYNYSLSVNGRRQYYSKSYLTSVLRSYANAFISEQYELKPFLMVIAPPAPHDPVTPSPLYDGFFKGKKVPRTKQFNYAPNEDKHWIVQMEPTPLPKKVIKLVDKKFAKRWETLLSVDDMVESFVNNLRRRKLLSNTYIIFTSDHGYHLGQFSMPWDKRQPYEFDIKVPLLIRGPGIKKNVTVTNPVILQDISATILHLAGLKTNSLDGKPFIPIKNEKERTFLIEYEGEGKYNGSSSECWPQDENLYGCQMTTNCKCQDSRNNSYFCIKMMDDITNFIYCLFHDKLGFEEAYNLKNDPLQLKNIARFLPKIHLKRLLHIMIQMVKCKGKKCSENTHFKFNYNYNDYYNLTLKR